MTLEQLCREVKFAVDEHSMNFNADNISLLSFMVDNSRQIARCAQSALRWLCRKAPVEMLAGSDEPAARGVPGIMVTNPTDCYLSNNNEVALPDDFVRLARVRLKGWNRSIQNPILENSEEYLMLGDITAQATNENPVVALVLNNPRKLQLFPASTELDITIIREPSLPLERLSAAPSPGTVYVPIPPAIHEPLIYMTAYLLLAAYRDTGAAAMYEIVKSFITDK